MNNSKSIKNAAKAQLSNNWSKALAAMAFILMGSVCIYLAEQLVSSLLSGYGVIKSVSLAEEDLKSIGSFSQALVAMVKSEDFLYAQGITLFFLVLRFLIISPIQQGEVKWYYSVAKGSKTYLSKVFFYFRTNEGYMSLLFFRIGQAVRQIIYGLISFAAAIAALSLAIYQFSIYSMSGLESDMQKAVLYLIVTAFLVLLGIVLYVLLMLKYFLAEYLFASMNDFDGGFRKVNACFGRSKELMSGQAGRVISLTISFIPAILSCLLIFPLLYVYPYMRTAYAVLARKIIKEAVEADNK